MLQLRPCCEHCAKSLPPSSAEARIKAHAELGARLRAIPAAER